MDDLHNERKTILTNMNHLAENKITLLRAETITIKQISQEKKKLKKRLEEIDIKTNARQEATGEMLKYIITFSELIKTENYLI